MSNSSIAKVNDNGKTEGSQSQTDAQLEEKTTLQVEANQAKSQDTENKPQPIALPVLELPKASTQPPVKEEKPGLVVANRPVESSHLEVHHTVNMSGNRPIASSNVQVVETVKMSGKRPIGSSNLKISETVLMSGNRPVASNDLDINKDLMSYLD